MFTGLDMDSSRCSSASPNAGGYGSPAGVYSSSHTQDFTDLESPFVPTVTAISSCPELQWMVQSVVSSVASSNGRAHPYSPNTPFTRTKMSGNKAQSTSRRGKIEQLAPEEEEKKRLRRERNKMAAAKCRNRRRELTDTLQAETDKLEDEKSTLQNDIASLLKEKERLEFILAAHRPICKIPSEMDPAFSKPSVSQAPSLPTSEIQTTASRLADTSSVFSSAPSVDLLTPTVKISDLDPSLEASLELLTKADLDTARSVPEVDLSSSLYAQDWEPLYTSASMDLEPLCTPVVTCTPTCTSYTSSFVFTYPDGDVFPAVGQPQRHSNSGNEQSSDSLSSPTLLTL